ncbi:uncharacterized protein LOC115444973 [Manduca sexta]|uniref:uncharacterized protein LOC115444973 n=1 Tax=Manduca sexta TaxID=7130 RepID=UPI00188E164D|nr:uncharacterized protein LOC115444973 [Manduca sexta]
MTIVHSELLNLDVVNNDVAPQVELIYPKLAIFENSRKYHIVDLKGSSKSTYDEEIDVVDKKVCKGGLLWLILKSGDVVAIDPSKESKIKIRNDKFKICQIKENKTDLYFISESGEYLIQPYKGEELKNMLEEGVPEIYTTFKKISKDHFDSDFYATAEGFNLFLENSTIKTQCPLTGLVETVASNVKCNCLLPWEDLVVVADEENMWLIDLKTSEIVYKFAKDSTCYVPIGVHDNVLYYIVRNTLQIQVCSASASSTLLANKEISSESQKITSQETLMNQLKTLVESILTSPKVTEVPSSIQVLFEEINNYAFLIKTSIKLCRCNLIFKSLLYSLQKKVVASEDLNLIDSISDLIIKVDLLEYIVFKGNDSYKDVDLFKQNIKELCITFISKSDLDLASICWLKYSEMKLTITCDDIFDILNSISHNTKIGAIMIWLKNFIPSLLDQNPFHIDIFVKWATERVFKLEQSSYWPKIGIKFIDEITFVLEKSLKIIPVRPISMDDLGVLKDRIRDILELKEKYKIHMLLNEFCNQSPSELTLIMLRRCYTEDLEIFLQNYLSFYATRHQFDLDDALRSFIESEATLGGGEIDGERLRILLDMFRSMNSKLDCLLQVLKVLDVPWNETVIQIVVTATTATNDFTLSDSDCGLVKEILKEYNYAKVKVILKKYNFPLASTDYILLLHKIINAPKVDLDDLKVITNVISNYSSYGNMLYLNKCLQDCEIKAALEYFTALNKKDKIILLKAMKIKFEQLITKKSTNVGMERNYLDFLKGTKLLNNIQMKNIENLFYMKNSYNLKLDMNNIHIEKSFKDLLTMKSLEDSSKAMSRYGERVNQITGMWATQQSAILTLLRRTPASHNVHAFVERLIIRSQKKDPCDDSILSKFENGENTTLLVQSSDVLVELLCKCNEEYLHSLMKYLIIFNALIKTNIVVQNLSIAWKFNYVYLPISSTTEISGLINFYSKIQLQSQSEIDLESMSQDFRPYDFNSFRMVSHSLVNSNNTHCPIQDSLINLCDNTARRLLNKIVANVDIDEVLIMALILILRTVETIEESIWIPDVLRGQNESLSTPVVCFLSSLPMRNTFCLDNNVNGNSVTYPPQLILKSKFNINLSEIALPEHSEETWDVKVILFYVLKKYPEISFPRLSEICRALNVSIDDGLSLQLISLLTNWTLRYKICQNQFGRRQIITENGEEPFTKCFIIWESIKDKEFLIDILNDFWRNGEVTLHGRVVSINPYYYEIFLCIYRLIFYTSAELRNMREYFLLNFLTEYTRKSPPKQYEFELFSVKGIYPEVGYFRLPFHLFMRDDMWSNLKSEITLETYERWLPVVVLLALDSDLQTARDMICSNALKQTMTSRKRNEGIEADSKKTEPWSLITREEPLLRAAHKCVRHISNMEWAGACLFYVLQGCSRGADQVAAAHLCYQFAQRWAAVQPGNRAVRQMERLNATLSTRHVLYKIEWACDELVRLSTEPAQLIRALYFHPEFIEKIGRHDVNRAANEIADKNGINVSSIRMQILENILEKSSKENNNDSSALTPIELITAKYILKATCPKMGAIYLSRIAFDDDSSYKKSKKLRALQCLISVIDADTAIKVTNRGRDALWISLVDLLCVVRLEAVDMPWIVVTFLQDKIRALDQLLHTTDLNVEALKIATMLACRYGSSKIIHHLLISLLRSNVYDDLTPLLLKISTFPPDGVIYAAWRAVILSPFQNADHPITERQRTKCINAINLLPLCPILKDEDLTEIWKNCVRCKCLGLGCLVLPYMRPQTRQTLPELLKIDRRNLIASLKNLYNESYLVSGAMHVIEGMASKMYR